MHVFTLRVCLAHRMFQSTTECHHEYLRSTTWKRMITVRGYNRLFSLESFRVSFSTICVSSVLNWVTFSLWCGACIAWLLIFQINWRCPLKNQLGDISGHFWVSVDFWVIVDNTLRYLESHGKHLLTRLVPFVVGFILVQSINTYVYSHV